MRGKGLQQEVEIKLRVDSADRGRRLLRAAGFRVTSPRVFEANKVFDTPRLELRRRGALLRMRRAGRRRTVTFKGPAAPGKHKIREELQLEVDDATTLEHILSRLGLEPVFLYEKYRTEFRIPRQRGSATLDETPIGIFIELEGSPGWIDRTARRLGYSDTAYITMSYGELYLEERTRSRLAASDMVFPESGASRVVPKKVP